MSVKFKKEDALNYHIQGQPGKIEVVPTKVLSTQLDLALAYSPGVAEPCKEIHANPADVYKYTSKGNLVAVISNGTAVLGLGDIGPEASKPVMEGKGVLFKKFAGIDVFDIEINEKDPDEFIKVVKALEPTFGGVNLEDIKAPECFRIETELKEKMKIPVMHDDQHGTAIVSAAALLNALEIIGKKIEDIIVVVNGAGAAAVSCTRIYIALGLKPENVIMCDSKGVLNASRTDLDEIKKEFVTKRKVDTLQEAMRGADVFIGLSKADVITPEDLLAMANHPIVFALANPNPEINYDLARKTRNDIIMATGRSDHPNQVNNVLGFPYIFRGALDVRATEINEAMKLAAVKALADLAKEPVPDLIHRTYGSEDIAFGIDYLIPKPMDPRLITTVAPAVAKAAIESGVAASTITDWRRYEQDLLNRIGINQKLSARLIERAMKDPKRIVFANADNYKILKAAQEIQDSKIGYPILLGSRKQISDLAAHHKLDIENITVIDPEEDQQKVKDFTDRLYNKRQRKGMTYSEAAKNILDHNYFGAMMVEVGDADAFISGLTSDYSRTISPALKVIGMASGVKRVAGMYIIMHKKRNYFFADATVNVNPNAEELLEIIRVATRGVRFFDTEPRVAVLSYSNFGSSKGDIPDKTREAVRLAKEQMPELVIEGDIQANVALNTDLQKEEYPFSALAEKGANTLIFPNLESGNIAYKLMMEMGGAEAIGPILLGMKRPVHILQVGSSIREIVNMAAIAVVDAQRYEKNLFGESKEVKLTIK